MNFNLNFIKRKRNELDISMQQMAVKLGFKNASTYLKYERGDYSFKAEQLPALAKALKCDVSDFFNHFVA